MSKKPTVAFAGLGAMGRPMAANLHSAGLLRAVWNRTRSKAETLAGELDVPAVETVADLAAAADIIAVCVSADEDVLELVEALCPRLQAGQQVVDFSTVHPATSRAAAQRCAAAGAGFVDAPVSGGTEGARNARLTIMAGGSEADLEAVRPVLEAVGARITHMGPVGAGQATKAANQIAVAGINQAVSEALAFAESQELDLDAVIEALSGGVADGWFLRNRGPNMRARDYPPGFRVDLHDKDLAICQRIAADCEAQLPVVEMTRIHYRRLMDNGHAGEDVSSLHRLKRKLFSGEDS